MAPCQFKRIRNVGPGPLLCPTEGESHPHGCFTWMSPPIFHPCPISLAISKSYDAGATSGDLNLDGVDDILDVVTLVNNILNP